MILKFKNCVSETDLTDSNPKTFQRRSNDVLERASVFVIVAAVDISRALARTLYILYHLRNKYF